MSLCSTHCHHQLSPAPSQKHPAGPLPCFPPPPPDLPHSHTHSGGLLPSLLLPHSCTPFAVGGSTPPCPPSSPFFFLIVFMTIDSYCLLVAMSPHQNVKPLESEDLVCLHHTHSVRAGHLVGNLYYLLNERRCECRHGCVNRQEGSRTRMLPI